MLRRQEFEVGLEKPVGLQVMINMDGAVKGCPGPAGAGCVI